MQEFYKYFTLLFILLNRWPVRSCSDNQNIFDSYSISTWYFEDLKAYSKHFLADQITNKIKLLIDQIILVYLIQIKWEIVLNIFVRFIPYAFFSCFLILFSNIHCNFDYQFKTFWFFIKGQRKCNTSGNTVAHNYIYTH